MGCDNTTITPNSGNPVPLPCRLDIRCAAALLIEPDTANAVVIVSLGAERDARLLMSPQVAIDVAMRLVGAALRASSEDGA